MVQWCGQVSLSAREPTSEHMAKVVCIDALLGRRFENAAERHGAAWKELATRMRPLLAGAWGGAHL